MKYPEFKEIHGQWWNDWFQAGHPYENLRWVDQDEFLKMKYRQTIRENRRKTLSLLWGILPETRRMMAARVATTLDAFGARAIDYEESPSYLSWGFRHSPVFYRPQNLLNYPSYCQHYPMLVGMLQEKNNNLPEEISDLIQRTWGMYFWWAPFDHFVVATGRDSRSKTRYYYDDEMLRVLKDQNYCPHYEEGKVVLLSKWMLFDNEFQYRDQWDYFHCYTSYLPIHPQTIQNVVGRDTVVDILEVQSYDDDWPIARWRIEQALKSMWMQVGKVMKIHFPDHGGGDGLDYTPRLLDQSGLAVDILEWWRHPPLIIVQNDYGKGKFHNQAMRATWDMWFLHGRTVFKYVLAQNEIGSDGYDGWWNVGDIELNMLTFKQICMADMRRIAANMLWSWDKDSEKIVRILVLNYLEEEHRERLNLSSGCIFDGESTKVITPEMFLERR